MIRKRKNKDGKTVYTVVIETGSAKARRRKSRTFKTLREAKAAESKAIATRAAMKGRSGAITLGAYIEEAYWPNARRRLAATSQDTYRIEIEKRIIPELGEVRLMDIDRSMIQKLVRKCKTKSVGKKCLGVVRAILNEAVADGFIASNPASRLITLPNGGEKRDNGLVITTFAEVERFARFVRGTAEPSIVRIVYLGMLQGLRPEERYALQWDDIDIKGKTITVRSAYVAVSRKHGGNQAKAPKTEQSSRTIPMHPEFYSYVSNLKPGRGSFVTDGDMLSPSTARHRWGRYLADFPELPRVTLENMRHSFATAYLEAGGRVETLSRILGHSTISTTLKRYVRPDLDSMRSDFANVAQNGRKEQR